MRSPRDWLRPGSLLALSVLAVGGGLLSLILLSPQAATRHNYSKVRLGMSQAELCRLLGTPAYQVTESGLVNGPESYSISPLMSEQERRQRGYQEYRRQQWSSSKVTIIAISDLQGRIVCRYTGPGHQRSWIQVLRYRFARWF